MNPSGKSLRISAKHQLWFEVFSEKFKFTYDNLIRELTR